VHALITGASGFVGGHLLPRLLAEGWRVTPYDLELDVLDAAAVQAAFDRDKPDAVIHLAAQASVGQSRSAPALTHRVNYLGTLSVLRATLRCESQPRLLLIGSGDQYGTTRPGSVPFTEDSPLHPGSAYARSKVEAEQLAGTYADAGADVVRVRSFNHAGPGQAPIYVLSSFARQIAQVELGLREPVMQVGNLESVRDIIAVDDVVEAYRLLLDRGVAAGVYNVAGGIGRSIGELLEILLAHATRRPSIEVDPSLVRPTDHSVGDPSRIRAATGWQPAIPIESTLSSMLDYWRRDLTGS
jgi:GDP-4-dehydro-6-deoxy-D-mannose reductase